MHVTRSVLYNIPWSNHLIFLHSSINSTSGRVNIEKHKNCRMNVAWHDDIFINRKRPVINNKKKLNLACYVSNMTHIQWNQLLLREKIEFTKIEPFSGDAIVVSCIHLSFFFRTFVTARVVNAEGKCYWMSTKACRLLYYRDQCCKHSTLVSLPWSAVTARALK